HHPHVRVVCRRRLRRLVMSREGPRLRALERMRVLAALSAAAGIAANCTHRDNPYGVVDPLPPPSSSCPSSPVPTVTASYVGETSDGDAGGDASDSGDSGDAVSDSAPTQQGRRVRLEITSVPGVSFASAAASATDATLEDTNLTETGGTILLLVS